MAAAAQFVFLVGVVLCLCTLIPVSLGGTFVVTNRCNENIWLGTNGQTDPNGKKWSNPCNGGAFLAPNQAVTCTVERGWAGRLWGRTGCNGQGKNCQTGDCEQLQCQHSGIPPVSLAELGLDQGKNLDFYAVSLVDGANLMMRVTPRGGNCKQANCLKDMRKGCPAGHQVNKGGKTVACDSQKGSQAFRKFAHDMCPNAYGYWNDDSKTNGCAVPGSGSARQTFDIQFC